MKKYYLETYGCQMNFAESASLENEFKQKGWAETKNPQEAEALILNTCSVRKSAEERVWGRLGFLKQFTEQQRPVSLVLTGCLADHYGETIRERFPFVNQIIGNQKKAALVSILTDLTENTKEIDPAAAYEYSFFRDHSVTGEFKAFVPIMHGCNNFCTYCIVPYVRGREISRKPQEILDEINALTEKGVAEVTLLGQNVNSYQSNNRSFDWLLKKICTHTNIRWLRFVSSHPKDLTESVIECMAQFPQICKSLHLPVQHGSNRILTAMNRRYTREGYLDLVKRLRDRIPEIALTTDLLIGFPGETEEDLRDTVDLIEQVGFDDAFTYFYNPRVGTKAAEMPDQLSEEVKKERLQRIIDIQRTLSLQQRKQFLNRTVNVLAESVSKKNTDEILGRTEQNNMVVFPGNKNQIGKFVSVKLLSLEGTTYKGVCE